MLEHGFVACLVAGAARVVVDVYIHEVAVDDLGNILVVSDEVGKAQAPWAPVATHLTNHKPALVAGLRQCFVDLCHWVDALVIYFLELGIGA